MAVIPMKAWSTLPVLISCATTARTVLMGIAKPIPMLPSEPALPVAIWALTPITCPRELISGPPELPWLMGASVWMTWSIGYWFGALIARCTALTIPAVTERS